MGYNLTEAEMHEHQEQVEPTKQTEFKIYLNSTTEFSFLDKIRILFGKKLHINSVVTVDKEVRITKNTESTGYVDDFFPRKIKGVLLSSPEISEKKTTTPIQ